MPAILISNLASKTTEQSLRSLFLPQELLGPGQIARPREGTAIVDFMMPMHAVQVSERLNGKELDGNKLVTQLM